MAKLSLPYKPRRWQEEAHKIVEQFTVLVMHRRAGKTVFNIMENIFNVLNCPLNRPQGAYIAPNYGAAKRIAWDYYKEFLAPMVKADLCKFHETELRIEFKTGAKIYLLGAEDPDKIRGMYLDHVVLDEYQDKNYSLDFFEKIIRPLLSDRDGKCIITGTPQGKNQLYEMYLRGLNEDNKNWVSNLQTWKDTGELPDKTIKEIKQDMSEESFLQEYECSFEAAIRGSYFGKNIARAKTQDRIKPDMDWDPSYPVVTGWDIGFDGTCVWYAQKIGEQIRIIDIDYFEDKDIPYVCGKVLNKPYTYQWQILPHDAVKRMITDRRKTAKGQIESLGLKCKIAPKLGLEDAIHAGRNFCDRVIFCKQADKKLQLGQTRTGALDALSLYRSEYDESRGVVSSNPVHDRYSHIGDAFRTLAVGIKNTKSAETIGHIARNSFRRSNPQVLQNKWDPFMRRGL